MLKTHMFGMGEKIKSIREEFEVSRQTRCVILFSGFSGGVLFNAILFIPELPLLIQIVAILVIVPGLLFLGYTASRLFTIHIIKKGRSRKGDPKEELDHTDVYAKGRTFEEIMAFWLNENKLFSEAKVTPKARDGDKGGDIEVYYVKQSSCVIQCKAHKRQIMSDGSIEEKKTDIKAVHEALFAREYYAARYAIVATNTYFTEPALDMAKAYGVLLLDRDAVKALIEGRDKELADEMPPIELAVIGLRRIRRVKANKSRFITSMLEKRLAKRNKTFLPEHEMD